MCTVYQEFTFQFEETADSLVKLTVCGHLQAETGGNGGQGANVSTESQDCYCALLGVIMLLSNDTCCTEIRK